jgi:hypothetical protein
MGVVTADHELPFQCSVLPSLAATQMSLAPLPRMPLRLITEPLSGLATLDQVRQARVVVLQAVPGQLTQLSPEEPQAVLDVPGWQDVPSQHAPAHTRPPAQLAVHW